MNAIFDFKRTGLLIQRHFIEKFQWELMFWGILIVCIMFVRNEPSILLALTYIIYAIYTTVFFKEIHSPTNRINYFMIPTTQFEKFTVSLLHTVVYCSVMMFAVYGIGNILGTWIHNLLANVNFLIGIFNLQHLDLEWVMFDKKLSSEVVLNLIIFILAMQSVFLLGGIYFKKYQLVKTVLALVAICLFFVFIVTLEAKHFVESEYITLYKMKNDTNAIDIIDTMMKVNRIRNIIKDIFLYLLIPYLWLTSYIRLTEKEV